MVTKHSVALAAGISAALIVSSAAFGVADGAFRSHASDEIAHFEVIDHAATTTTIAHPRASSATTANTEPAEAATTTPRAPRGTGTAPSQSSPPPVVTAGPAPGVAATATTATTPPIGSEPEGDVAPEGAHDDN